VALFGKPPQPGNPQQNHHHHQQQQLNTSTGSTTSPADPDTSTSKSTCSNSSSANNFSLDLSIGARAALEEHRRHVCKYGIDGAGPAGGGGGGAESGGSRRSSFSLRGSPDGGPCPPADEWDRINDGSTHVSFASTFIVEGGGRHDDNDDSNDHIMLGRSFLSDASRDDGHPLDDGEDDEKHSDYFNSSRVKLLATPERNKPMVDEASRRARELAVEGTAESGGGVRIRHHVTGRGNVGDDDDNDDDGDGFGGSSIGLDDSTVGVGSNSGSTEVGDTSGMAFLFREAMRLNEDALASGQEVNESNDQDDTFEADHKGKSADSSFVSFAPDLSNASRSSGVGGILGDSIPDGENFVECEEGIEFVADISDVLSVVPFTSAPQTPARGTGGMNRNDSHQKPPVDPFSTPRRGSPRRRMAGAEKRSADGEKENSDFNLIGLSPIASKAGAEAEKLLLSVGSYRHGGGVGTPSRRTPLRQFGSPETGSRLTPNRSDGLTMTPGRSGPIPSLNDSNISVSMIDGNDASVLSHALSPFRNSPDDDDGDNTAVPPQLFESPERISRSNSADSPGNNERSSNPQNRTRSLSVDSPGRRDHTDFRPRRVVKSLGARYSQPDRFEDDFAPLSPTYETSELNSVSRSLLESFET